DFEDIMNEFSPGGNLMLTRKINKKYLENAISIWKNILRDDITYELDFYPGEEIIMEVLNDLSQDKQIMYVYGEGYGNFYLTDEYIPTDRFEDIEIDDLYSNILRGNEKIYIFRNKFDAEIWL